MWNSLVAAGFTLLTLMKLAGAEVARWFAVGSGATGVAGGLAFALFGVGHLVGLSVGMAQPIGRASCRERVCQRLGLGGGRLIEKTNNRTNNLNSIPYSNQT